MGLYRRVQLTGGEDGDVMYVNNEPLKDKNCTFKGYSIVNVDLEAYCFEVTNLYTDREVTNIPFELKWDIVKLKEWIYENLEDVRPLIEAKEKAHQEYLKRKEEERIAKRIKEGDKYLGVSSTTFYKVKRHFNDLGDKECMVLTAMAIKDKDIVGPYAEVAENLRHFYDLGLLNMTAIEKKYKAYI